MRRVLAAYIGLGVLLSVTPLLNVLQAESTAVLALVAYFVAGTAAARAFRARRASPWRVLRRQEAALLVPLAILTVAQLWAPNCTYGEGLLFFVLFPGVTVVFAVALAYAVSGLDVARPGHILVGIGLAIVVAGPLYDLGLHPQFYTYNHVFGGVLGPIYDEQLAIRPGLFVFRGLTLLWALVAGLVGHRLRGRGPQWALPVGALLIGTVYLFSGDLGINTPAWKLEETLGGHERTAHFDLYFDPDRMGPGEVNDLARAHEARYAWVRDRLELPPDGAGPRIQSYIYPNPDVKGRLTGARTTSVSPVWLSHPQIHLLRSRVEGSLGHELAHVVGRPYGVPVLHASWAPGLIEGWAVALEPPSPGPQPDDLVLTAATTDTTSALQTTADAVADRLSPWGFWTGRGAVSYATMGSFVEFLLERYGPAKLKHVYTWGKFETVYGRSLADLSRQWAAHLRARSAVARDAHGVVSRQFTRPSLFETECPHYVPPARRHLQAAQRAGRERDTTAMVDRLQQAIAARPSFAAAHAALGRIRLAQGQIEAARQQLDTLDSSQRTVGLQVVLADARAAAGAAAPAETLYTDVLDRLPQYYAETRARLMLRTAVVDRPDIVRVLVSGDSAHVQAHRLARKMPSTPAIQAWRGVRLMEARDYESAFSLWQAADAPLWSGPPRSWNRVWRLQWRGWGAEAAMKAGHSEDARRWAQRAAEHARSYGASARASMYDWWSERSESGGDAIPPTASHVPFGSRAVGGAGTPNHDRRLLVGANGQRSSDRGSESGAVVLASFGSCSR